jgi:hypothetical protein
MTEEEVGRVIAALGLKVLIGLAALVYLSWILFFRSAPGQRTPGIRKLMGCIFVSAYLVYVFWTFVWKP